MKKIGMIGGMSWESSKVYYEIVNGAVKKRLGGLHSAVCVMDSVDFADIEVLQHRDDWDALNDAMAQSAVNLEQAKAELIILCTNTMHLCSDAIQQAVNIPFLHIATATGQKIKQQGLKKVLLLGTRFTMEKDFYRSTLERDFGVNVVIPDDEGRDLVHRTIYEELVLGDIQARSKAAFVDIINHAVKVDQVEGAILGCTEIPLLIQQEDVNIPVFDTTRIHAESAVDFALRFTD
ncbi:MAG: aspartate/glutamate racemase family protein [Cytophagales bacterium]|nr:aspartate/glutamate racemase family protein [Cytophagales bacterium]